jgi:hypothetical protein
MQYLTCIPQRKISAVQRYTNYATSLAKSDGSTEQFSSVFGVAVICIILCIHIVSADRDTSRLCEGQTVSIRLAASLSPSWSVLFVLDSYYYLVLSTAFSQELLIWVTYIPRSYNMQNMQNMYNIQCFIVICKI